jgi:hypothetical protein
MRLASLYQVTGRLDPDSQPARRLLDRRHAVEAGVER